MAPYFFLNKTKPIKMTESAKILSDVVVHMKYAKYRDDLNRRESWEDLVTRNMEMHIKKFPNLEDEIREVYKLVYAKKVLPSMRSLQFGGKPIEINPSRIFNCSYLPLDHPYAFSEIMFLLLSGCGVGFSVQKHHIEKLPEIKIPKKGKRFLIGDSIEGWADAIKALIDAYLKGKSKPKFDFSDIRAKGMPLITSGGKAPGPSSLKECLIKIENILSEKTPGDNLTSLECHDIVCHIADCVLAGGIRRAALISLFDFDDTDMISCKYGSWWELHPQRGRANNSAIALKSKIKEDDFRKFFKMVENSRSGEPGIVFSNDKDWGVNPCCEISLRPYQFCNLTEINGSVIKTQEEFNALARAASFIGTLQASYTDFHYLRDVWKKTTERDALVGTGITGIANKDLLSLDFREAAEEVKNENERVANIIGIKKAARTTCVKPSGTSSSVLGTSSGIHAWHDPYYIRRIRVGKNEAIYHYLNENHPELVEDEYFRPTEQAVIQIPIKAPEGSIFRDESIEEFLERVKKVNLEWVQTGHRNGMNYNNVSATVSVKDDEWERLTDWMWDNRDSFTGLSVLPYDGGTYIQAPFETITEERYNELSSNLTKIDLTEVIELTDETNLIGELACAGGSCEIK